MTATVNAADLFVDSNGAGIQAAIDAASDGDTIHIANGTYAEQPESSSPVGEQMRDIRAASSDVKALIATVSRVSTIAEFEEAHRRAGTAGDG